MIDLRDGKITDLINNQMAYNPETISIGYAILQEKQRLIALAERTRLMAVVENLDEWVLDYLAVELRAPAYEDSFPIEVKRELIAGTLPFYAKLGTPKAINWATQTIFGGSQMQEWFEYGGEPYHFRLDVLLGEDEWSGEKHQKIRWAIELCKNLRSHLDGITYSAKGAPARAHAGGTFLGSRQKVECRLKTPGVARPRGEIPAHIGVGIVSVHQRTTVKIFVDKEAAYGALAGLRGNERGHWDAQ